MKWVVFNGLGATAWLAGLFYARDAQLPTASSLASGDHQFLFGLIFGLAGLATLLWANFRETT